MAEANWRLNKDRVEDKRTNNIALGGAQMIIRSVYIQYWRSSFLKFQWGCHSHFPHQYRCWVDNFLMHFIHRRSNRYIYHMGQFPWSRALERLGTHGELRSE
jgi:hypothetical protein